MTYDYLLSQAAVSKAALRRNSRCGYATALAAVWRRLLQVDPLE
jgi:hypothetical protein